RTSKLEISTCPFRTIDTASCQDDSTRSTANKTREIIADTVRTDVITFLVCRSGDRSVKNGSHAYTRALFATSLQAVSTSGMCRVSCARSQICCTSASSLQAASALIQEMT